VEITYGLDRIAMSLQKARHFAQLCWTDTVSAGDVNLRGEYEHSAYYLDVADVATQLQLFDIYAQEAARCLKAGLVLPAHDYVLRMSQAFNVLDARGGPDRLWEKAFLSELFPALGRASEVCADCLSYHLDYRERPVRYRIDDSGALWLYTAAGKTLTARR